MRDEKQLSYFSEFFVTLIIWHIRDAGSLVCLERNLASVSFLRPNCMHRGLGLEYVRFRQPCVSLPTPIRTLFVGKDLGSSVAMRIGQ